LLACRAACRTAERDAVFSALPVAPRSRRSTSAYGAESRRDVPFGMALERLTAADLAYQNQGQQ
jgi:hypothetical protein